MGKCNFCKTDGCSDSKKGCPEREKKIIIHEKVGKKANQGDIPKRLMKYLRDYSAYSLGITSDSESLIEKSEIKFEYRKMFILWEGDDPAGIAKLWGVRVKQIRKYKSFGKRLISTGPTELNNPQNGNYSLYLLVR